MAREVRDLIRKMSRANPLWGAPRIHGEILKLGIELSQATVAKYLERHRKPPSPTWRTFLDSHLKQLVATDFFVVLKVNFRILFVFVVLAHHRRRVIHFNVTAHPTSEWTAQQIAEAFPWDTTPPYLLHDRDSIYGEVFRQRVRGMGIREVLTAPRSTWQNPYAERLIGSIRRECLDHLVVFSESSLRRTLKLYFDYYHGARTHLSLEKDAPRLDRFKHRSGGRSLNCGGRRTASPLRTAGGLKDRSRAREGRFRTPVDRGPQRQRPPGQNFPPAPAAMKSVARTRSATPSTL